MQVEVVVGDLVRPLLEVLEAEVLVEYKAPQELRELRERQTQVEVVVVLQELTTEVQAAPVS
jgi:hypothetical protein